MKKTQRKPVKKRNSKRAANSFKRNFHSKARVLWVKGFCCVFCRGFDRIRNAHMTSRGAGGTWRDILPVCVSCDQEWERGRKSFLGRRGLTWQDIEKMLDSFNELWLMDSE